MVGLSFIVLFILLSILLTCFYPSSFLKLVASAMSLCQESQGTLMTFILFNLIHSKTTCVFLDALSIQHGYLVKLKETCATHTASGLKSRSEDG